MEAEQRRRLLEALRGLKKNRPVLRTQGLSQNEFFLLYHMKLRLEQIGEDAVRIGDLQTSTHTSLPAVSQSLGTLEAKGCVARRTDPDDHRSVRVALTEKGRRAIDDALAEAACVLERIEERFGEENMETLISLMERLSSALDELWEEDAAARKNKAAPRSAALRGAPLPSEYPGALPHILRSGREEADPNFMQEGE